MKNIIYGLGMLMIVMISSCGKEDIGKEWDFSDTQEPYIIIGKAAIETKPDSIATVRFTMRTGLSKALTIKYTVTGSVDLGEQTVTMDKFTTAKDVVIDIPTGTATPSTTVVTLLSASKEDGTPLVVGRYGEAAGEQVEILIDEP